MATNRNRVQGYLSDFVYEKLTQYQKENELKSLSVALEQALESFFDAGEGKPLETPDYLVQRVKRAVLEELPNRQELEAIAKERYSYCQDNPLHWEVEELKKQVESLSKSLSELKSESKSTSPLEESESKSTSPLEESESKSTSPLEESESKSTSPLEESESESESLTVKEVEKIVESDSESNLESKSSLEESESESESEGESLVEGLNHTELAQLLGVNKTTTARWAKAGKTSPDGNWSWNGELWVKLEG